jgi:hypothetical protein
MNCSGKLKFTFSSYEIVNYIIKGIKDESGSNNIQVLFPADRVKEQPTFWRSFSFKKY